MTERRAALVTNSTECVTGCARRDFEGLARLADQVWLLYARCASASVCGASEPRVITQPDALSPFDGVAGAHTTGLLRGCSAAALHTATPPRAAAAAACGSGSNGQGSCAAFSQQCGPSPGPRETVFAPQCAGQARTHNPCNALHYCVLLQQPVHPKPTAQARVCSLQALQV